MRTINEIFAGLIDEETDLGCTFHVADYDDDCHSVAGAKFEILHALNEARYGPAAEKPSDTEGER